MPVRYDAAAPAKLFALIRHRWAARPKRTLADWIALTIARGLSFAIVGDLVYVTYIVEMTSYDDFRQEQHRHAFGMGPRLPACG